MAKRIGEYEQNDSRLRAFHLYQMLERYTDENHPMTTNQIRDLMKKKYGIYMHRTTVYYDIDCLKAAGVSICCKRSRNNQYYFDSRKIEMPVLKLLIDVVESSEWLTAEQSRHLTEKLKTLTSEPNADKVKSYLHLTGSVKADSERLRLNVDKISKAISSGRMICFQYLDYARKRINDPRLVGRLHMVSPYSLIWNGDHYYLVGFHHEEKMVCSFRVDMIKETMEILSIAANAVPEDYDVNHYTRDNFRIYDAEKLVPVTLVCENCLIEDLRDAFGKDIKVRFATSGYFMTTVNVCLSTEWYGWVFQRSNAVKIIGPDRAVTE